MKLHDKTYFGVAHTSKVIPPEERPRCMCCGKPLKFRTDTQDLNPDKRGAGIGLNCDISKAKAWSALLYGGTTVALWLGEYHGYVFDDDGVPVFCTKDCGLRFARVMWEAGRRVNLNGELLDR